MCLASTTVSHWSGGWGVKLTLSMGEFWLFLTWRERPMDGVNVFPSGLVRAFTLARSQLLR